MLHEISRTTMGLLTIAGVLLACTPPSGPSGTSSRAESSGTPTVPAVDPTDPSAPIPCETFGGTCTKGSSSNPNPSCAAGLAKVVEGAPCDGPFDVCCTDGSAGSRVVEANAALLCTTSGFTEFAAGTCGSTTCAVGGTCMATAGGSECDLSRGLPPTKDGAVECAVFGCGSITCGEGCSCADAQASACSCP